MAFQQGEHGPLVGTESASAAPQKCTLGDMHGQQEQGAGTTLKTWAPPHQVRARAWETRAVAKRLGIAVTLVKGAGCWARVKVRVGPATAELGMEGQGMPQARGALERGRAAQVAEKVARMVAPEVLAQSREEVGKQVAVAGVAGMAGVMGVEAGPKSAGSHSTGRPRCLQHSDGMRVAHQMLPTDGAACRGCTVHSSCLRPEHEADHPTCVHPSACLSFAPSKPALMGHPVSTHLGKPSDQWPARAEQCPRRKPCTLRRLPLAHLQSDTHRGPASGQPWPEAQLRAAPQARLWQGSREEEMGV